MAKTPKPGDQVAIADLRPTQLTLGFEEVERRLAAFRRKSLQDRTAQLIEKAAPNVIGPGGEIYVIDHHHFLRVLHEAGETRAVMGETRADLSDLAPDAFWREMLARDWCWPIDRWGNRRACRLIPAHIRDLGDNPWRSFARSVRGDAYDEADPEDPTPFREFRWGEYFRGFLTERMITEHPEIAADIARKLAKLDQARDLPGWRGKD